MTQLTDEQQERVKQIRERHLRVDCYKSQMRADIDFLLSLLSANVVAPTVDDDLISRLAQRGTIECTIELEKYVDLLYRFARHVRNTDEIPPLKWGVDGMWLLAELRELDPERYGKEVFNPPGFGYPSAVVDTEDSEEEGNTTPASTVAPVEQSDESGWLLEKMHNGNVHYIAANYLLEWTDDPNKALRLARREDAEALCTIVEDCEKIAEHGWPAAAPLAARQDEASVSSKVLQVADSGSAEEFGDALERLRAIRQMIDSAPTTEEGAG